jgi:ferredoxin--NADP+ reductase
MVVRFRFLTSPLELLSDDHGHVAAVRVETNTISVRPDGEVAARGTGEVTVIPAELVLRSIGYVGQPVAGIPFDARRGLIRNDRGRVTDADGTRRTGEYVTGWIKRGASGVIGTNKKDSRETVDRILEDAAAGRLNRPVADEIEALVAAQAERAISWEAWEAIDKVERLAGEACNPPRPRVKLAQWEALRDAAGVGRDAPTR